MPSTYSALKIELIANGEQTGTWGTTTNTNLGTALEEAIVGSSDVAFASADVTLTLIDSNVAQTARALRLNLTGVSGGARNLLVPNIEKQYIVTNNLLDAVTIKNSTGTGIAVPAGETTVVYNDSVNVASAVSYLPALKAGTLTLTNSLGVSSGGTGNSSLVANSLLVGNGTSPIITIAPGTSGNLLTSTGTGWVSSASGAGVTPGKSIALAMIFGF